MVDTRRKASSARVETFLEQFLENCIFGRIGRL